MDNLKRNRGKLTCATAKGNTESRSGEEGKKNIRWFWLTIPNIKAIREKL